MNKIKTLILATWNKLKTKLTKADLIAACVFAIIILSGHIIFEPIRNIMDSQNKNLNTYVSKSGKWNIVDFNAMVKDCNGSAKCVWTIFKTFPDGDGIKLSQIERIMSDI